MSTYRVHKSKVRSVAALKAALVDRIVQRRRRGLTESQAAPHLAEWTADAETLVNEAVEVYQEPVNLIGYQGDVRSQTAHVVWRRQFVNAHLGGGASNDVGFLRSDDGAFEAIVSDYDQGRWWSQAAPRFWQAAMAHEAETAAVSAGFAVHRSEENGVIKLVASIVSSGANSSHGGGAW